MHEILFRGKRADNGEWVYGDLIHRQIWKKSVSVIIHNQDDGFDQYEEYEIVPSSVGQYTGLNDRNNEKIFDGDILQGFWYCEGVRAKVVWIDDAATFGILYSFRKSGEKTAWLNSSWYKFTSESPCFPEIIGNIHDNPELLKGE